MELIPEPTIVPNRAAIRQWVAALRSGEYEQTSGYLTRVDGEDNVTHCCLGVACVIFADEVGLTHERRSSGIVAYKDNNDFQTWHSLLPTSVREHLGLTENPRVNFPMAEKDLSVGIRPRKGTMELTALNDSGQYSFADIALAIENTYLMGEETNGPEDV